jgi:hypothetical protein
MTPEQMAKVQTSAKIAARLKSLCADLLMIIGLALICWGVGKFSVPAGFIATGSMLIIFAVSVAPKNNAKKVAN